MTFQREVLSPTVCCSLNLSLVIHRFLIDGLQTAGNKELCIPQVIPGGWPLWVLCLICWLSASCAVRLEGTGWSLNSAVSSCWSTLANVFRHRFCSVGCRKVLYNRRAAYLGSVNKVLKNAIVPARKTVMFLPLRVLLSNLCENMNESQIRRDEWIISKKLLPNLHPLSREWRWRFYQLAVFFFKSILWDYLITVSVFHNFPQISIRSIFH